jgi:hypothetical protein
VTEACRDRRDSLAVAATGRLEPAERAALGAHVDRCDACRSELRELTAVARMVEDADADRVRSGERPLPRPELRHEVLARVATERAARLRRRRLGLAGAAAALVIVASLLVGVVVQRTDEVPGDQVELDAARGVMTDARGSAVLEPQPWGTQIHLEVVGLEPGTEFEVWVLRLDDSRVPAGTFVAAAGPTQVVAAAGLPPDQAQGVGLSTATHPFLYGHLRDPE